MTGVRFPVACGTFALALLLAAASVAAQTPDAAGVPDGAVDRTTSSLVDKVAHGIGSAAKGVGQAAGSAADGVGTAAGAVGRLLQAAAQAVADGAFATAQAAADAAGFLSSALAGLAASAGLASLAGVASLGALVGTALAAAGDALAAGASTLGGAVLAFTQSVGAAAVWASGRLAALASLYAGLVAGLRPHAMPPAAFAGLVAAGAAASAGASAWGLAALARRSGWLLGGLVAGFSRIEDDELLRHPLRAQVFQVIQGNPGIHASELGRRVGTGWGTIVHHLDKLEKGRLVAIRKVNNQKCYFEAGGKVSRQDMAVAGAVRGDSASRIASYVASHPMTSQKSLAAEVGISPALASFHVKKLVGLGVLDKVRSGKETLLTTTDALRRIVAGGSAVVASPPLLVQVAALDA
ncbi:MAG: hypothetical protein LC620_07915 [Halobacteriales archaeon]|nr:hypothetical protein [Halobacteriales archaeon]